LKDQKFKKDYKLISIDWEYKRKDPQTYDHLGNIDINFRYIRRNNDCFFAFECKRLNLINNRSNASEYTGKQGMMCFITGKYRGDLNSAGMIGYVMDGNYKSAIDNVQKNMRRKCKELYLIYQKEEYLILSSLFPSADNVRESRHELPSPPINFIIHHIFLPF
jgi:hypothetical protein